MVRHALASDIPRLVELASREHAGSMWSHIPFDPDAAALTARIFIEQLGYTTFISDAGYLAGMVQRLGFSDRLTAIEFAWYAEDHRGLELLSAFEEWAEKMGAVAVIVRDPSMGRLTRALGRRRGYKPASAELTRQITRSA